MIYHVTHFGIAKRVASKLTPKTAWLISSRQRERVERDASHSYLTLDAEEARARLIAMRQTSVDLAKRDLESRLEQLARAQGITVAMIEALPLCERGWPQFVPGLYD